MSARYYGSCKRILVIVMWVYMNVLEMTVVHIYGYTVYCSSAGIRVYQSWNVYMMYKA